MRQKSAERVALPRRRKIGRPITAGLLLGLPLAVVALSGGTASASDVKSDLSSTGTQQVTLSVPYACDFPVVGTQILEATITGDAPSSVAPGQQFSITNVQSTTTVPAALVDALLIAHKSVSGTISTWDFTASGAQPNEINGAATPITFGPVALTSGQPASITAPASPATIGPFTAGHGSDATVTPGDLTISTWFGTLQCTLSKSAGSSADITIPIGGIPLPIGTTLGGVSLAAFAGAGFIWRQRRKDTTRMKRATAV